MKTITITIALAALLLTTAAHAGGARYSGECDGCSREGSASRNIASGDLYDHYFGSGSDERRKRALEQLRAPYISGTSSSWKNPRPDQRKAINQQLERQLQALTGKRQSSFKSGDLTATGFARAAHYDLQRLREEAKRDNERSFNGFGSSGNWE